MDVNKVTEFARAKIFGWASRKPRTFITFLWFFSMLLAFIAFIFACVAASHSRGKSSSYQGVAFTVMWLSIILGLVSAGGTYIMRKLSTAIMIGVLIGVMVVLNCQTLIVFSIVVSRCQKEIDRSVRSALTGFAVFVFFLFLVYTSITAMLHVFFLDIVKVEKLPPYEIEGPVISSDSTDRKVVDGAVDAVSDEETYEN